MSQNLIARLDSLIAERSLLLHPFYQAWNAGTLPIEALREYAGQYYHFEATFPRYLSAIHARCPSPAIRQAILENLWDEEHGAENHVALWLRFCGALGLREDQVRAGRPRASTRALVDGFHKACAERSVGEGLVTLYAYESQSPEIARQKLQGLARNYGMTDGPAVAFFSLHQEMDLHHAATEREALLAAADAADADSLLEAGRAAADLLWGFLDGAYAGVA